ncbi:hypothetical protein FACS1894217_09540 [Clostridia bacterium]|nr:hypothetical protein FACS1894217_09540 [Clostridia bacterium]
MKYVYPAVFTPVGEGYDVRVPDLPGCGTCGDDLADAMFMVEDAMSMWLWYTEEHGEQIPPASAAPRCLPPQFVNLVRADTDEYRRQAAKRAFTKKLSFKLRKQAIA